VPLNWLLAALSAAHGPASVLRDPLRGFEASTWGVIVVNGLGGLLVALVIKHADNIWKGFATAGAIILTGAIAPTLGLGPPPSGASVLGTVLVVAALFMYATPPRGARLPGAVSTASLRRL
jgi:UDP-sugar transporter A1/2/3